MLSGVVTLLVSAIFATASYAPQFVPCPSNGSSLRLTGTPQQGNQTINPAELAYTTSRKSLAVSGLVSYLNNLGNGTVYGGSVSALTEANVATVGIALSGGGDRAALYGAGVLAALDGRNSTAVSAKTGGFLQASTYVSALSGGSWLLTSFIFNNVSSIYDLVLGNNATGVPGWNLVYDVFNPGNKTQQETQYIPQILADIAAKKAAGPFNVTFGDYWARALAHHYLPGSTQDNFFSNASSDHGASITLSSATSLPSWQNFSIPFPIILGDVLTPNNRTPASVGGVVSLSNVIYELSPVEFGSYDPQLGAFLPMKYLGTAMNAGTPSFNSANGSCVVNFDNAGFTTGISSNLFALYNLTDNAVWTNSFSPVNLAWTTINSSFYSLQSNQQLDISAVPNPFKGINVGTYQDAAEDQLRLIDGGLDGQVDPVAPLVVTKRGVEMILVVDATADSQFNQPTGASLVATYNRALALPNGTTSVPPLPSSTDTYISQGLNVRPTFFGCKGTPATLNGTNVTSPYPIIVFLPNFSPSGVSNTSTSTFVYQEPLASAFLDTSVGIATRGFPSANGTADTQWATCLACTTVERMRGRLGVDRTSACTSCFTRYCWNEVNAGNGNTTASGGGGTGGNGTGTASGASPSGTGAKSGVGRLALDKSSGSLSLLAALAATSLLL